MILIYAKFSKDLFIISKVIANILDRPSNNVAPFFGLPCIACDVDCRQRDDDIIPAKFRPI